MATYTWTLPTPSASSVAGGADLGTQFDKLFGRDLYLEVNGQSGPDLATTKAGDWLIVTGRAALRQSLIRRWITTPGQWATKPEYGAGALAYVKGRNNTSSRQELAERIRAQTMKDRRVARVHTVEVDKRENALVIRVVVIPRGEANQPLPVTLELS